MATRLPTLKAIMAENGCDIDAARTYRAFMEADADAEHFRKTGKHLLTCTIHADINEATKRWERAQARPRRTAATARRPHKTGAKAVATGAATRKAAKSRARAKA